MPAAVLTRPKICFLQQSRSNAEAREQAARSHPGLQKILCRWHRAHRRLRCIRQRHWL